MKDTISFLQQLARNNNRQWFGENKARYSELKERFDATVSQVIEGIRRFDPDIAGLTPEMCTYRIYRDTRFSLDKTPYKTHMCAFIAKGGKKAGYSGYYFEVGASSENVFPGGCLLAAGDYQCPTPVLNTLREDIDFDNGAALSEALAEAAKAGFILEEDRMLKRVPRPFAQDHPAAQLLRHRSFCLVKPSSHVYYTSPQLVERLCTDFAATKPFIDYINRAIEYTSNPD